MQDYTDIEQYQTVFCLSFTIELLSKFVINNFQVSINVNISSHRIKDYFKIRQVTTNALSTVLYYVPIHKLFKVRPDLKTES